MKAAAVGLVVAAACSGRPRAEDAHAVPRGDAVDDAARQEAGAASAAGDAAGSADHPLATGDLQVRVEWPDAPAAARTSPGRTRCNTPRAPSLAPTTTWGIPEALVVIDSPVDGSDTASARIAHISFADCALSPRIAVGDRLAITSAVDRPAKLALRKRGALDHLAAGPPVPIMLPIAGHTAIAALDAGAIYSLETDEPEPEIAFIAALPAGRVTDATGHVLFRDVAVGAHAVTAWLPPRGGQPARLGRGTATVTAGELTELTVRLSP